MRSESITRVNKRLLWQYVAKHRQQNITLILIIRQNKNYTKTRFIRNLISETNFLNLNLYMTVRNRVISKETTVKITITAPYFDL